MKSHEVPRGVVEELGAKQVASDLGVSTSLVYKWCARPASGPTGSGARNPLDRRQWNAPATSMKLASTRWNSVGSQFANQAWDESTVIPSTSLAAITMP